MVIEGLFSLASWFIRLVFQGFHLVSLPLNLISVVIGVMRVGAWVVGADLIAITFSTIIFWLSFRFVAGLILFIWRLLPLT